MGSGASKGGGKKYEATAEAPIETAPAEEMPLTLDTAPAKQPRILLQASKSRASLVMNQVALSHQEGQYDLIVMGGGPAGVRAAVEGAGRGLRVALVEPKQVITGAPTGAHSKCMREAVLHGAKSWPEVEAVLKRAVKLTENAAMNDLITNRVEVLHGSGYLTGDKSMTVTPIAADGEVSELTFDSLVIATGSKSNRFPPVNFDLPGVYDSDTIATIQRIPKRMIIQGAGIIGLEYGQIFAGLGTQVTIIEMFDQVVPFLDVSLQDACKEALKKAGVEIILKAKFQEVRAGTGGTEEEPAVEIELADGRVFECDCLFSACGRSGNSKGFGLEALEPKGMKIGRGSFIQVDGDCWTGVGKIYAVGDVAGANLATVGQAQAIHAVRCIFGSGLAKGEKGKAFNPSGVWTIPELAWAGITEAKAIADSIDYGSVVVGYDRTIRGCVTDDHGFLKLIYEKAEGTVLGVHIFGEHSCDLINYGAEEINSKRTVFDMLRFVFPAVTYHELYNLAAREAKLRLILHLAPKEDLASAQLWKRVSTAIQKAMVEIGSVDEDSDFELVVTKCWKRIDTDGNGKLSNEELHAAMETLGLELSEDDIKAMIADATQTSSGSKTDGIEFEEFVRILKLRAN